MANGAERLKKELETAAAECLGKLKLEMLSMPETPARPASF
jgi:hypothetical protein